MVFNPTIRRLALISVFLLLDVLLGVRWIRLQRDELLVPFKNFLVQIHPALPEKVLGEARNQTIPAVIPSEAPFTTTEIVTAINTARNERKLPSLKFSEVLSEAGDTIIDAIIANNVSFEELNTNKVLTTYLQQKKVENIALFHDTLIGPRTMAQLQNYWDNNQEHLETLASPELTEIGVATRSAVVGDTEQGIVIMIYGKPQAVVQQSTIQKSKPQKFIFPEISNAAILEALNVYRASHGIHSLQEHPNLCTYAEKRVQDLVNYGGLDGHEGFKKDFADQENIPQAIRDYPGGAIGENLAYQNCRNMQTNQGFLAETATALIEWCFDSSTKGHREAQLNPRYNNVCARHQDGYFVIIFGE